MAKQGLAALTSGIQEGYEFVDSRKREKQVQELLGRENTRLSNLAQAEGKDIERLSPGDFDFASFEQPPTIGQKIMGWVGNLVSPQQAQPQAIPTQTAPAPGAPVNAQGIPGQVQPEGATTFAMPQYKHGGSVRQMRKKYANGGRSLGPHQGGPGGNRVAFQPYEHGGKAINEDEESALEHATRRTEAEKLRMHERLEEPGISTAEYGSRYTDYIGSNIKGARDVIGAGMVDTGIPGAIAKGAKFVGGMLGYGTGGENKGREDVDAAAAVRALPVDKPPEQLAAQPDSGAGEGAPVSVGGGQSLPATPSTQPRDEEIDFSTQAREVMPEDMPAHSSKDWEEERNYWAASAIMKGQDPFEAMKKVDQQQLNGFTRYSMQATALIDGGDLEGATRALYAAYQYFPNGKNVKFGVQKGKDGQRVIVAMGSAEESGESSGPPQILNSNTISRMVENLQKPGALRAWTTDWQTTEGKLWEQGYKQDVLKEAGRANRAKESIDRYEAVTAARGGGMKQSDWDRAFGEFMDSRELQMLGDESTALDLADVMTRMYQRAGPSTGYPSIIKMVMAAHEAGALDEMREQYGLQ